MTELVASIAAPTMATLAECADAAFDRGADVVELRVDSYDGGPEELNGYLRAGADRAWIVTCRGEREGGCSHGSARDRAALVAVIVRDTSARVDFEWSDWSSDANARDKLRQILGAKPGSRLILSAHDFDRCPADLDETVRSILADPSGAMAKVAYQARSIADSFDALDLMHEYGDRITAIAMGIDGLWSRVLAAKLGGAATYCSIGSEAETAPGQLTVDDMIRLYRFGEIDATTRVFGVIGDPVEHSMSPELHNRWFRENSVNAVYLPLRVRDGESGLRTFLDGCRVRPWLDVGGFSVTVPHKISALKWCGEGVDQVGGWVGAVNTLVFSDDRVLAYNTDCYAAVSALADALRRERRELVGLTVGVLGAGGAARAVLLGLREYGCDVTIYARSPDKAQVLAEEFGFRALSWERRVDRGGQVLINCTSVGMWPKVDESPLPEGALQGCRLVFDLIYNPIETRLMRDASTVGVTAVNGLDMFVRQAATQFELWTEKAPDRTAAGEWIADALGGKSGGA